MAENKTLEHLPEVRAAVAALSPEDRKLLAAVQASPFKLTALEQFKEFAANTDYFVFEPNIHGLNDLGWRYLAQHMDMLLPPELLKAIDPVPFGKYVMQEEQGHFTEHGYISLSGDSWVLKFGFAREKFTENVSWFRMHWLALRKRTTTVRIMPVKKAGSKREKNSLLTFK